MVQWQCVASEVDLFLGVPASSGLTRLTPNFELMSWVEDLELGDRKKREKVQHFPLCWIASTQMTLNLDLAQGTLSGGASIEFQKQFPDQV